MHARELKVGDALHERIPFKIPKYQRAYAWRDEQIDDFNRDLTECWKVVSEGQERTHFFGGIVTVLVQDDTLRGNYHRIIDGQQRLATFTILISLIERAFNELAEEAEAEGDDEKAETCVLLGKDLRSEYLTYRGGVNGRPRDLFRLELSRRDFQFFPRIINHEDPAVTRRSPLSHRNLKDAYVSIRADLVEEILRDSTGIDERIERLKTLQRVALDHSIIIHITGDSEGEGHRLFQVLNDRGAGLTDGDLLRSRALEILESHAEQQEFAEEAWDTLLAEDISTVDHFLRAFYSSRMSERPRRSNLYDDFKREFLDYDTPISEETADEVLEIIQEIEIERSVFLNVLSGEWPYEEEHQNVTTWDRNRLKLLMLGLNHKLCIPLLLAAVQLEQPAFRNLVKLLERFVFRYVIVCDAHVGKLNKLYMEQAAEIRDDPESYRLSNLTRKLRRLQNDDAPEPVLTTNLPEKIQYKRGGNKTLKYFLTTVEDYLRWAREDGRGTPKCLDDLRVFDLSRVTIEHIYPQRAQEAFKDDELEEVKHRLGNLSFWSPRDNVRAGNDPFDVKRDRFNNSMVGLNQELAQLDSWDLDEFDNRQDGLIDLAIKIFAV